RPGPGREAYLKNRNEFLAARTNLVEIDLLRVGAPTVLVASKCLSALPPYRYCVGVSRAESRQQEFYPINSEQRLPHIRVPLAAGVADVPLDLQAVLTRCWNESSYPEILRYDRPPSGPLTESEQAWCDRVLTEAGLRDVNGP